jgi:hypothetical protein
MSAQAEGRASNANEEKPEVRYHIEEIRHAEQGPAVRELMISGILWYGSHSDDAGEQGERNESQRTLAPIGHLRLHLIAHSL